MGFAWSECSNKTLSMFQFTERESIISRGEIIYLDSHCRQDKWLRIFFSGFNLQEEDQNVMRIAVSIILCFTDITNETSKEEEIV